MDKINIKIGKEALTQASQSLKNVDSERKLM
jgi:hypothetical protein